MWVQIQIHLLTGLDSQESERSSALIDERENRSIGRVVEAVERTVVNGEAVLPQMKSALDAGK